MFLYKITNNINGKSYIGQTSVDIQLRWKWHCFHKGCTALYCAIKKYGKNNFNIELLEICNSINMLNDRERKLIKKFNTLCPNGYNISLGGRDGTMLGRHHTEETKQRISKRLKEIGHKPILTPESIKKMSNTLRGRKLGPRSEEVKRKISIKNSGKNHGMYNKGYLNKTCTPIQCSTTGKIFISQAEAARQLNLSQSNIYSVLTGKRNHTSGFKFKYLKDQHGY